MTSTERVIKFKERQKEAGRKPVTLWLSEEAIRALRERARPLTQGEIVEQAVAQLISNNAQVEKRA